MKNYFRIFFLTLSALLLCYACKKDKTIINPVLSPSPSGYQALKDLCYFKTGSYWVYQDSLHPTDYDSVYVIQDGINWDTVHNEINCIKPGIYELFGTKTKNSKGQIREYICQSEEGSVCSTHGRLTVQYGSGYGSPFISSWFIPGYIIQDSPPQLPTINYGGRVTYINNYDSINVNGVFFKEIREVNHNWFNYYGSSTTVYSYKDNTNHYLSSHIGLVRRVELDSNRVWNLIRYHIVQ